MKSQALLIAGLLAGVVVVAQQPPAGEHSGPPPRIAGAQDAIGGNFFPPELVMQNQKAIGLTEEQTKAIREEMQKNMAQFTDLQWQQSAAQETFSGLLKAERIDDKAALAELDKLLAIESQVKKLHLTVMIHIKNILTPEQQAKLRELRPQPQGRTANASRERVPGNTDDNQRPQPLEK